MQQRVGIARAYASESDIMLLDEPFGALDAQTRYSMEDEILRIWEKDRRTVIFVTNNVEEAIYLGDRIILLGGHPTGVKKEYVPDLPQAEELYRSGVPEAAQRDRCQHGPGAVSGRRQNR